MACEDQINTEDLINAKSDAVTLGEVATSRAGAVEGGVSITTSTNRFGEVTDTVQGRLNKLGVLFDDPIRDWSASLLVSDLRAHRYPATTGDIYIPTKPLPFTTGGTFNADDWVVLQGITSGEIINDISQAYEFKTRTQMINSAISFPLNKKLKTSGKAAELDGMGADYVVQAAGPVDGDLDVTLSDGKTAINQDGLKTSGKNYNVYNQNINYYGSPLALTEVGAVVIIGDSITEGDGATTYKEAYANLVMRSLFNSVDQGAESDRGYRYETVFNFNSQLDMGDITTTGSIVSGGVVDGRLQLAGGQSITITNREISSADIYYDADVSNGNIEFRLNGNLISTKAVSGAGIQSTFDTQLIGLNRYIRDTDTVTITASGGTLTVTGLLTLRSSFNSPLCYVAGKSGWGFDEYAVQSRVNDLADHVNSFRSNSLVVINLGTNNIYNPSIDKTPEDYIAALDALITKYDNALLNKIFIISVPPKADINIWPAAQGFYNDYVIAIERYGRDNNLQILRHDKSSLSDNLHYSDGLHPNNTGHAIMAQEVCRALALPYNPRHHQHISNSAALIPAVEIAYNDLWSEFTSSQFTVKAYISSNLLSLSGIASSNSSLSTLIGTLPIGYRPIGRDCFVTARTSAGGSVDITVGSDGTINMSGVIPSWVSFEGVVLTLERG